MPNSIVLASLLYTWSTCMVTRVDCSLENNSVKKTIQNTLDVLLNPVADTFDNLNQMIKNTDIKTRASIIIGMLLIGFVLLIFSKVFFKRLKKFLI
jgi:hypothetical protein